MMKLKPIRPATSFHILQLMTAACVLAIGLSLNASPARTMNLNPQTLQNHRSVADRQFAVQTLLEERIGQSLTEIQRTELTKFTSQESVAGTQTVVNESFVGGSFKNLIASVVASQSEAR